MLHLVRTIHTTILTVLLSIFYFVVFAPFAVAQFFDPLGIRPRRDSMLAPRGAPRLDPRAARRPY
jgi:hypothetical protein